MPFASRFARSLRGQLIGLVAALGLPLLGLQAWLAYREYSGAVAEANVEALALADENAERVRQFMAQTERLLQSTAATFGPGYLDPEIACDEDMRATTDVFTFLVNAMVVDAQGNILCSARVGPSQDSALDWEWFPVLAAGGSFGRGSPINGAYSEEWILPLAAPIHDEDGGFIGAFVGAVPLTELGRLIGRTGDPGNLVTIADAQRIVLARSIDPEPYVGGPLAPEQNVEVEVTPGRAVARGPDFDNVDRTWGQVEMANGWTVYAGAPSDLVYGPARADFARHMFVTLTLLGLALLLAGRFYRRIVSALSELSVQLRASNEGPEIPIAESTPLEVRAVAAHFNQASRQLHAALAAQATAGERYQSIFDNAVFGLYVSTADGRFLEVNPALVSLLGYESEADLVAAGPAPLYEDLTERRRLVDRTASDPTIAAETRWVRADGTAITVLLTGKKIVVDGEDAYEMIVQDVTEARRVEDELRQTQKMEAIGKLAGGIAHDFNNLLTVIGGNAELVELGLGDDHPLLADLDQVLEATQRATTLTTQLLAFSRKEPHSARVINVHEVLTNMERMLARLIGEDVELDTRLSATHPTISIDAGELEQVIMNLVLNARDAMPRGGRVVIESSTFALDAEGGETGRKSDGLLLSVSDTGDGMDGETSKRMFEPFYTTKPVGEGTGLGLATVYGIVQRAGGQIRVQSEPGSGTSIDLWFPLASRTAEDPSDSSGKSRTGGSERVLVVEDEDLVRVFVRRALEEAGYEVIVAVDGVDALQILEELESPVDLVLTDVVMPRMKGPEMAERLAETSPHTPILFMSGYIDNRVFSGQLAENPDLLLRKPFSTVALHERVRAALDQEFASTG